MDSAIIYHAANDLVQSNDSNIKRIARSCSLDISETPRFKVNWYHRKEHCIDSNVT